MEVRGRPQPETADYREVAELKAAGAADRLQRSSEKVSDDKMVAWLLL